MTEPGFYQSRLQGRASGRLSPRDAIRAPRREQVLANHDLIPSGAANPHQGQLFNPRSIPSKTPEQIARERGVAPPLASSKGGFMPGLQRTTPERTRAAKATAVKALGAARARTGNYSDTPVKDAMADRAALYAQGKPADWYQPVSEGRNVMGEGMARTAIDNAALRTGVSNEHMTRAVALTSPRTAWDAGGAPGTTDYSRPNIESAENVIRAVKGLGKDPSVSAAREAASMAPGKALNQPKMKAAEYFVAGDTKSPIRVADPSSQKVPNFEQSLHMSHVDPAIVRQASGSYTVDSWDTAGIKADEKMLKSDTGYAIAHMTGVRAALKAGELPPNFQARSWNALREMAQPVDMGTNRLFETQRGGRIVPNRSAMPPEREETMASLQEMSRLSRRTSTADKYGLEF